VAAASSNAAANAALRDLLTRGITYKLQERKYGGLSMATARKLEQAAAGALYLILQNRLYRGEIAHRLSRAKVAAALEAEGWSQRRDPKSASRDPAAVHAPYPGIWSLWLALMRSSDS